MDADEYKRKYRSAQRSSSLGTTDWMEQVGSQNINLTDSNSIDFSTMKSTWGIEDGMTITTSSLPAATAYTLSSALSMK